MTHTKWFNADGTRMKCATPDCTLDVSVSGHCRKHYLRLYKAGKQPVTPQYTNPDGTRMACTQLDCDRPIKARFLCQLHYERVVRAGSPKKKRRSKWTNPDGTRMLCLTPDCDKPILSAGVCSVHYSRGWRADNRPKTSKPCPVCGRTMINRSTICGVCNQARWRYGLELDTFLSMWEPNARKCANIACGSTENLHIDHDHRCCPPDKFQGSKVACGKCVRGWLCKSCNVTLGFMNESAHRLSGLIDYLNRYQA